MEYLKIVTGITMIAIILIVLLLPTNEHATYLVSWKIHDVVQGHCEIVLNKWDTADVIKMIENKESKNNPNKEEVIIISVFKIK